MYSSNFLLLRGDIQLKKKVKPDQTLISLDEMKVYNIGAGAVDALAVASETYIVGLLEDSNLLAIHARHTTVTRKDVKLAR